MAYELEFGCSGSFVDRDSLIRRCCMDYHIDPVFERNAEVAPSATNNCLYSTSIDYAHLPTSDFSIEIYILPTASALADQYDISRIVSWGLIGEELKHVVLELLGPSSGSTGLRLAFGMGYPNYSLEVQDLQLEDGAWHHVAATVNGSHIILYVDFQQVAIQGDQAFVVDFSEHGTFCVGGDSDTTHFKGSMKEAHLYDRARTQMGMWVHSDHWWDYLYNTIQPLATARPFVDEAWCGCAAYGSGARDMDHTQLCKGAETTHTNEDACVQNNLTWHTFSCRDRLMYLEEVFGATACATQDVSLIQTCCMDYYVDPVVDEDAEIYIDATCYYNNLVTGASPAVLPSSSFTIEAYIHADAKPLNVYRQTARIVGWGPAVESGDWRHVSLELVDDWQKLVLELGQGAKLESGIGLQDTVWHHIAATADQESGEVRLYFDHVEVAAVTRTLSINISDSTSFCIGGRPGGSEMFKGHIRGVQLWEYARTASEITTATSVSSAHLIFDRGAELFFDPANPTACYYNDQSSNILFPETEFSVEAQIKPLFYNGGTTPLERRMRVIGWGPLRPEDGSVLNEKTFVDIVYNTEKGLQFFMSPPGGMYTIMTTPTSQAEITEDEWLHVAVTFDGSTAKIYADYTLVRE
eukprot:5422277-Amphidinium_carterae.1